jgi:hypothetical protein
VFLIPDSEIMLDAIYKVSFFLERWRIYMKQCHLVGCFFDLSEVFGVPFRDESF